MCAGNDRALASLCQSRPQLWKCLHAAAEGKSTDKGGGGGNGTAYGLCSALSLASAGFFAFAPHTVSATLQAFDSTILAPLNCTQA